MAISPMPRMNRPHGLSNEQRDLFLRTLHAGASMRTACEQIGRPERTVQDWILKGRWFNEAANPSEDDAWYGAFFVDVCNARSAPVSLAAATLTRALNDPDAPWSAKIAAAIKILDSRDPRNWNSRHLEELVEAEEAVADLDDLRTQGREALKQAEKVYGTHDGQ